MTGPIRQVLFVQGAGAGTHDEWDDKLVAGLRRELGDGYQVRYPRMPGEDDPTYASWSAAIRRELATLDEGAILVGHSVGGAILVHALGEQAPPRRPAAVVLLAAPFVGPGGWPGTEFELPPDLGARLPPDVPVHIVHGLRDDTVPPEHADRYAEVVPQARVTLLPEGDHQLGDDLAPVAELIA